MGLFNRLPRELRDMVYEQVFGNDFVYLSWFQPHRGSGFFGTADRSAHRRKGNVAFLRTCRNVYVEAIRVLYSTNTFGFGFNMHTNTPHGFFLAISSQHLAIITSVYIAYNPYSILTDLWNPSERTENWTTMWATIATEMQMLKDVSVKLGSRENWGRYLKEPGSDSWEEWFHSMACATPKLEIGGLLRFEFDVDGTRRV